MTYGRSPRRRYRLCAQTAVVAVLILGCSPGGDRPQGSGSADAVSQRGSRVARNAAHDRAHVPADGGTELRDQARRLARDVVAEPADWGAGFVKSSPYESGPDRQSELSKDCVWEQKPLPPSQLAGYALRSELPGEEGKEPLRVSAVVTVHRSARSAEWEMARTLEEALRCPAQRLSATERITGLKSSPGPRNDRHTVGDDTVKERGRIHRSGVKGSQYYTWAQSRIGRVTAGATAKASEGHTDKEVDDALAKVAATMVIRAERQLEGRGE